MDAVVSLPECRLRVQGHWVYVRQCTKPDQYAGTVLYRPDKDLKRSHVCEVLAVGPEVGRRRTGRSRRTWCRVRRIPLHLSTPVTPGMFVLLPENSPHHLLKASPFSEFEFMVDESVILAVLEGSD